MKKIGSLILSCILLMSSAAFAETTDESVGTAEDYTAEHGISIRLTREDGIEYSFTLPEGWIIDTFDKTETPESESSDTEPAFGEVTDELPGQTFPLFASSEDGLQMLTISWTDAEETPDADALLADYVQLYEDAHILTISDVDFVTFTDAETGASTAVLAGEMGSTSITLTVPYGEDASALLEDLLQTLQPLDGETQSTEENVSDDSDAA